MYRLGEAPKKHTWELTQSVLRPEWRITTASTRCPSCSSTSSFVVPSADTCDSTTVDVVSVKRSHSASTIPLGSSMFFAAQSAASSERCAGRFRIVTFHSE